MTHHTSYTAQSPERDSSEQREQYAQRLLAEAFGCIAQLAALDSSNPSAMLDVVDELRSMAQEVIDADLVEVAPGVTLPSADAERYIARKTAQANCARCKLEDEASWLDADEYDALLPTIEATLHSCHITNVEPKTISDSERDELMAFVESRCELSSKIVIAHRRSSDDACERLTIGCCVDHAASGIESNCETW